MMDMEGPSFGIFRVFSVSLQEPQCTVIRWEQGKTRHRERRKMNKAKGKWGMDGPLEGHGSSTKLASADTRDGYIPGQVQPR